MSNNATLAELDAAIETLHRRAEAALQADDLAAFERAASAIKTLEARAIAAAAQGQSK